VSLVCEVNLPYGSKPPIVQIYNESPITIHWTHQLDMKYQQILAIVTSKNIKEFKSIIGK